MLSDAERLAIQRHVQIIVNFLNKRRQVHERLYAPHVARMAELQKIAERPVEQVGPNIFSTRGHTPEESAEVLKVWDEISAGLHEFDRQSKPDLTPWDTPRDIAEFIEGKSVLWGNGYLDLARRCNGSTPREKQQQARDIVHEAYVAARGRVLKFVRLAPSVRQDFPEAREPLIGIQDILAWCEDAMRPVVNAGHDAVHDLPVQGRSTAPNDTDSPAVKAAVVSAVELGAIDERPRVRGKTKPLLNAAPYAVIKALLDAKAKGIERLTSPELERLSNRPGAGKYLRALRQSDPDWEEVILLPRCKGDGYGLR